MIFLDYHLYFCMLKTKDLSDLTCKGLSDFYKNATCKIGAYFLDIES